jgi:hypothetical protein
MLDIYSWIVVALASDDWMKKMKIMIIKEG